MSDKYEAAIAYARDLGAQHGRNAAEWYAQDAFGGRARGADESARGVAQGIADGDPEILDSLPYPDLSGQWADSLTGPQLYADALAEADFEDDAGRCPHDDDFEGPEWFSDICDAYEDAFSLAAQDEVDRLARLA